MPNIVGQNIKNKRLELGLTQEQLAQRVGVTSKAAISRVENGHEDLTTVRVKKYAEALNCTPAELMGWNVNNSDHRLVSYYEKIINAYKESSLKDKKAICAILDIPFEEDKGESDVI